MFELQCKTFQTAHNAKKLALHEIQLNDCFCIKLNLAFCFDEIWSTNTVLKLCPEIKHSFLNEPRQVIRPSVQTSFLYFLLCAALFNHIVQAALFSFSDLKGT